MDIISVIVIVLGLSLGLFSYTIIKGRFLKSYGKIALILAFILFIGALILIRIGLKRVL
ncbi:MAG: hypothetical protein ACXVHV_01245 [Methanobacterium sp.]